MEMRELAVRQVVQRRVGKRAEEQHCRAMVSTS